LSDFLTALRVGTIFMFVSISRKTFFLSGLVYTMIGFSPLFALSLNESVALAIKTHPDVLSAQENIAVTQQQIKKSTAGWLPTIDASAGYGWDYNDNTTTRAIADTHGLDLKKGETSLNVNQVLFDGMRVKNDVLQNRARLKGAEADLNRTIDDTALRTAESYLDVVTRKQQLELIKDNVLLHQRIYKKIKIKFEAGVGTEADIHQSQSRTYLASANHASSDAAYRNTVYAYTKYVGVAPKELVWPQLPKKVLPETLQASLDTAIENNPLIQSRKSAIKAAKFAIKKAQASFLPGINLELAASDSANVGGSEEHVIAASAMLRLNYNLFRGGLDSATVKESMGLASQSQQALDRELRDLKERVEQTWARYTMAQDRVRFLKKHVAVSKKVTASYHDQFKVGKRTLLDVLNSENELFSAKNSLLNEKLNFAKAVYQMLAAIGNLRQNLLHENERKAGSVQGKSTPSMDSTTEPTPSEKQNSAVGMDLTPGSKKPAPAEEGGLYTLDPEPEEGDLEAQFFLNEPMPIPAPKHVSFVNQQPVSTPMPKGFSFTLGQSNRTDTSILDSQG
jgi:outer membrane protein, adhesin transport system